MSILKKEFDIIKSQIAKNGQPKSYVDLKGYSGIKEKIDGRELILYGCGIGGYAIGDWLTNIGIKINGVCDSNRTGVFPFTGQEILSPNELKHKHPNAMVLISSKEYYREIEENLLTLGFPTEQILCPPDFPGGTNIINIDEFQCKYLEGFIWAYDFYKDEISKSIIIDSMYAYLLGRRMNKSESLQYFERDIICLEDGETFIDGGAYFGDSVVNFVKEAKRQGIKYRSIYSFECEKEKCEMLKEELSQYRDVTIVPKGLWSCDTELVFSRDTLNATSSVVFDRTDNKVVVPLTSLDIFFKDKSSIDLPTFIKMDIEGAENEALLGAAGIIKSNHPKLAICVYHKPEDMYDLPKIVYKNNPDYRFYLRQYTDGFSETVMYAV